MVCLGFEPGAAKWKVETNPLSYGDWFIKIPMACVMNQLFLKKWANPGLFFVYFRFFQTNIVTVFTTNKCEKCPSSIRCRDSNSQPSDYKSSPLTTRPGLPPYESTLAVKYEDWAVVVVVKWSACLPSLPTIRVQIPQSPTVFSCKICVWKEWK